MIDSFVGSHALRDGVIRACSGTFGVAHGVETEQNVASETKLGLEQP
jgi:hypothetical protein